MKTIRQRIWAIERWLIRRIRKWLWLDDPLFLGFDIGHYEPTVIIIASNIDGGRMRIIKCRITDRKELQDVADRIEMAYGQRGCRYYDAPRGYFR